MTTYNRAYDDAHPDVFSAKNVWGRFLLGFVAAIPVLLTFVIVFTPFMPEWLAVFLSAFLGAAAPSVVGGAVVLIYMLVESKRLGI